MPKKTFTNGDVLPASDVNTYLMEQAVMTFANSAARTSALTSPVAGMVTYLIDTDTYEYWDGTEYAPFGAGPEVLTLEYLIVAGGGGGGGNRAGGGGAGGYRSSIVGELSGSGSFAEPALQFGTALGQIAFSTNYAVTVGAGGAGGGSTVRGTVGVDSSFVVTSSGGGGGGAYDGNNNGINGGCGGGMSRTETAAIVPGFGSFQGFSGNAGNTNAGGGGGGAGALGVKAPSDTVGGAGGAGRSSSVSGSAVTRSGGGGGGSGTGGAGGTGGGGAGGSNGTGTAGTVNTGGGGGGGGIGATTGGSGGSGIVILKYPSALTITIGAGLTGSTATVGSNKVTTITAGSGNVSWVA